MEGEWSNYQELLSSEWIAGWLSLGMVHFVIIRLCSIVGGGNILLMYQDKI